MPGIVVSDTDVVTWVVTAMLPEDDAVRETDWGELVDSARIPDEAMNALEVAGEAEDTTDEEDEAPMMVKLELISPESPNKHTM